MNPSALLDGKVGELEPGLEFTTRGRTITEGDLTSFSALTGDWHPQHSDAEWAAHSRFSGRVAHGMLVLSYAVGLVPFDPERVVALRGLESATFKRPVAIGDTIRVRCRVDSSRPLDDEAALVRLAFRVINQNDRAVALARVEAVCRQTPGQETNGDGYWPEDSVQLYGGETFL
jgi:3-hydroxybutyryl-CoA dehydratase